MLKIETIPVSFGDGVINPVHPGEIIQDYLTCYKMSPGALAKALNVPRSRIERIVKGRIGISTDTALRLSQYFRTSSQFWINIQTNYEVDILLPKIKDQLDRITPLTNTYN